MTPIAHCPVTSNSFVMAFNFYVDCRLCNLKNFLPRKDINKITPRFLYNLPLTKDGQKSRKIGVLFC